MKKALLSLILGVAAFVLPVHSAKANLLQLAFSGTFSAASTLNDVAFGTDTAFSYTTTFDPGQDFLGSFGTGMAIYSLHDFTLVIGGSSYTSTSLGVVLADPSSSMQSYAVGVTDLTHTLGGKFSNVTVAIDAMQPVPTVFSGFAAITDGLPFTTALALDGSSNLVVDNISGGEASLTAVPEASSWAMIGLGLPALLGAARWRKRKA